MEVNRKKCKVVMLPTENESNIWLYEIRNKLEYYGGKPSKPLKSGKSGKPQHLYIVSDDEIKEGDWYIGSENQLVHASRKVYDDLFSILKDANSNSPWKSKGKIIATTDESLTIGEEDSWKNRKDILYSNTLPKPSQAFIKKYCELGGIDEILVEYDCITSVKGVICDLNEITSCVQITENKCVETKLKINSHNEITIHSVKNSWTREEVEALCRNAYNLGFDYSISTFTSKLFSIDHFIKENL